MIRHYYRNGYEYLEDTMTGVIVSKPEQEEVAPEDLLTWEQLWWRLQQQDYENLVLQREG